MSYHFRAIAFTLTIALLSGCSYLKFPGVYKFPIQQGNVVTQDMIDQLKPGMTRSQVRFVLGTPLIEDTFDQDRWDYLYSVKLPNGIILREQVTVYFIDNELSGIGGDYLPSSALNPAQASTEEASAEPLNAEADTEPDTDEMSPTVPIPDEDGPSPVIDEPNVLDQGKL